MLHRTVAHTREMLETLRDTPDVLLSAEERRSLDEAIDTLSRLSAYLVEMALPRVRSVPFVPVPESERAALREGVARMVAEGWLVDEALMGLIAEELKPPSEM